MKRKKTRRYISGMLVAVLLFLLCVVQNVNAEDVPAGSELPRLVDDADILTDSEEKELNQQLDTVSEEQECDVIIVTVDSLNGKTVEEYADDYYDDNGYGYGENDIRQCISYRHIYIHKNSVHNESNHPDDHIRHIHCPTALVLF